jgi:alginate O-acetyltransferase complex protein AlgI
MVFTSFSFLFLFLPLFLAVYALTPQRWRNLTLLVFSWVFYAWWRLDFLPLIVAIAAWSWATGGWIASARDNARRQRLCLAIAMPLLALVYFKYANLLVGSAVAMGAPASGWQAVLLPIGLSFFVFGAISYSVDVYRGTVPPEPSFIDYATYQSMFGHLVAGPVVRYAWVAARLHERPFQRAEFATGCERFLLGFASKVLVADTLAPLVDSVFSLAAPSAADVALGVVAYALQLYFDFAGYSGMAIGLGLMVGLRFPENFNHPYLATSLADFWRRWHISLSSWLRDYLYIPLGGSRHGAVQASRNLLITMGLGGLWHGASWTFLVWGLWHGAGLVVGRIWRASDAPALPALAGHVLTLVFVLLGWLLFRAANWDEAMLMGGALLGGHGWAMSSALAAVLRPNQVLMLLIGGALIYLPLAWRGPALTSWLALPLFLCALWVLQSRSVVPFLYFQF